MVNRAIIENLIKLKCMIDTHTPQRMLVFDLHSAYDMVISLDAAIEALSADRNGEWKEDETGHGFWICSSCGFVSEASGAWLLYRYCPNCGADMRGERMTREEAKSFLQIRYENAKDFSDPNWEAQERREHREYVEALRMAIEALSADHKGHWIYHENDMCCVRWDKWECSECHERVENKSDYCPHCGADMRSK